MDLLNDNMIWLVALQGSAFNTALGYFPQPTQIQSLIYGTGDSFRTLSLFAPLLV